jgi:plastocyanin
MRTVLAFLLTAALLGAGAAHALAASRSVTVGDDWFVRKGKPPTITVRKGTTVTWRWTGQDVHNVHARKGPVHFRSGYKRSGTYSRKLTRRGTYVVYCDIHPPGMRMTIRVR